MTHADYGGQQAYGPPLDHEGVQHAYGAGSYQVDGGAGSTHQAALAGPKRPQLALDDFFGAVKRQEIDPTSYHEVAGSLAALHGLEIPISSPTSLYGQPPHSIGPNSGHLAPEIFPPQDLPHLTNLRSKRDLLHAEHFLQQSYGSALDTSWGMEPGKFDCSGGEKLRDYERSP